MKFYRKLLKFFFMVIVFNKVIFIEFFLYKFFLGRKDVYFSISVSGDE